MSQRQDQDASQGALFSQEALETCTYCPRLCRDACPVALAESNEALIPTHKIGLVELWQRGLIPLDPSLAQVFYACTDCGACTSLCKHEMEPAEILYKAREHALDAEMAPESVVQLRDTITETGTPFGAIAEGPETTPASSTTSLFVGCACAAQRADHIPQLRKALQIATGTPVGLFDPGTCCGAPLAATGAQEQHTQHSRGLAGRFHQLSHLIIADPHCLRHIHNHVLSPHGKAKDKKISHAFAVLEPSLKLLSGASAPRLAFYHDSSALGRFLGMYDEPRRLLGRLGYQIIEFTRSREKATASGAGGIYRWTSPDHARRHVDWLLQEVRDVARHRGLTDLPPVITVGETERSHLASAAQDIEILDLNALLADAILAQSSE